jgi:hypothetical protein
MIAPEEERFSLNTGILIDAVKNCLEELYDRNLTTINPNTISIIQAILTTMDKHFLIKEFISNSHEFFWEKIKNRDESFFIENANEIFKKLPIDKINIFKDLFTQKDENGDFIISVKTKNEIWHLFDTLIKISIKYIHKNRKPKKVKKGNLFYNNYEREFMNEVILEKHIKDWNVNVEFPN